MSAEVLKFAEKKTAKRNEIKTKAANSFPPDGYALLTIVCILTLFGLVITFSASFPKAIQMTSSPFFLIRKQILSLFLGIIAGILAYQFCCRYSLKSISWVFWIISMLALMLTFVPGVAVEKKGSARWVDFGIISFQPSELVKLATIILISKLAIDYLQKREKRSLRLAFVVLIVSSAAVLLQKDMTTATIIFVSGFVPLFLSQIKLRELAPLIGVAAFGAVVGVLTESYRLKRLLVFLNPWKAGDAGHQVVVSLRALSEGGIKGVGLGMSNLKYNVLPEAYTDFIFAVLGSELGLIGSLITIMLIFLFFVFGFRLSSKMPDAYSKLVSYAIITLFSIQSIINIGGCVQLLPPTGVPLPFVSYGGSSLVVSFVSLGVIFGLYRRSDVQDEYFRRRRGHVRPRISAEKNY